MNIAVAGATGWAPPPAPRALLVHPGGGQPGECLHISVTPPSARPSRPRSPPPLTCARSGAQNSHLHSRRYSHGGLLGGADMTPGSDRGSRGRRPHSPGHSNLQIGSESSGHWPRSKGRSRRCASVRSSLPPGPPGPLVFILSPRFHPDHSTPQGPTWPAFAGKGLPEVSAISVGGAGPGRTGVGHDTAGLHVHSLAGGKQGRGPRRRGAEPYSL